MVWKIWEMVLNSFKPACNVNVLMLKGVFKKYQKPLAYYFANSVLEAQFLKDIIIKAIKDLQELGLSVIAVSTDMGGNFIQLYELLGANKDSPFFL